MQKVIYYYNRTLETLRCYYNFLMKRQRFSNLFLATSASIIMMIYSLQRVYLPFVYDAGHYWRYADQFLANGTFSLTNYSTNLRGYLFPFLLFLLKILASLLEIDPRILFSLCSALFFAALSVYLLPWAFHLIFDWEISFWGRSLMVFLVFFFWRGHFLYPLSDFLALSALLIAIAISAHLLRQNRVSWYAIWIGCFVGAVINIRPVYQASLFAFLLFGLLFVNKLGIIRTVQTGILAALGLTIDCVATAI